jgi:glycosyltransferase involved in cell wall biosynthesis
MSKISIAICAYNGEKYLQEQLDSFAAQTRLPDEVVICDDCSQDATRDILERFAESARFPVKLHFNEHNLGFLKNFEKAIRLCAGEIIILSDQDDVWHEEKIELIEAEFAKSEKVGMVYADAEIVNESLEILETSLWQKSGFDADKQKLFATGKAFDLLLVTGYVYGSSMAFRARFRDLFLPFPENVFFIHDNWIAFMICSVADISLINKKLTKYRQHERQFAGIVKDEKSKLESLIESGKRINEYAGRINQLLIAEKRFKESSYHVNLAELLSKMSTVRKHISTRSNLPKSFVSRLFKVGRELLTGNYHHYSNGFRSAAKDLFIAGNSNFR